jgi:hypothetical protein
MSTLATSDPVGPDAMTATEARETVALIRASLDHTRELILELHDRKGWQALGHPSWRRCVEVEFGQHRTALYKQIEAAKVAKEIEASDVENFDTEPLPDSHLRALSPLPAEDRVSVYREASAEAGGKPTAAQVKAVVERKLSPSAEACEVEVEPGSSDGEPEPFSAQEARDAFAELLAVQESVTAIVREHGYNPHLPVVRQAQARLRRAIDAFDAMLPGQPVDDLGPPYVVAYGGDVYVADDSDGRWCKAYLLNFDTSLEMKMRNRSDKSGVRVGQPPSSDS